MRGSLQACDIVWVQSYSNMAPSCCVQKEKQRNTVDNDLIVMALSWSSGPAAGCVDMGRRRVTPTPMTSRLSHTVAPAGVFPQHANVDFTYGSAALAPFREGRQAS